MLNTILSGFYERDLRKLIEEINLFKSEKNLWKTSGSIRNSSGNLALHIIGGSNHLFGTILAKTDYVRNRDREFTMKGVDRKVLVAQLELLIPLIRQTLKTVNMEAEYPIPFDDKRVPNSYVMVQLLAHLSYHTGQINYLRKILE